MADLLALRSVWSYTDGNSLAVLWHFSGRAWQSLAEPGRAWQSLADITRTAYVYCVLCSCGQYSGDMSCDVGLYWL